MRILITGGDGEFCKHLVEYGKYEHSFLTPTKKQADIRDYWKLDRYFYQFQNDFDCVIHAGAITRPMVIHEDNPSISIQTNIVGTSNVVLMCERYNKKIIYISTDYVYEGKDGNYKETDAMKPFTKYGWSKLGGECAVQMYKNSLIIRLCMTERPFVHGKAYANVMSNFIYQEDAAKIILKILNKKGIVNVGGPSQSIYNFARNSNKFVKKILSKGEFPKRTDMNLKKLRKIIKS